MLLKAGAQPVSFEEMAAGGIPNPATVVYELEIAGVEIEHLATGVRLLNKRAPPPGRSEGPGFRRATLRDFGERHRST
jgi:hypothetical protein